MRRRQLIVDLAACGGVAALTSFAEAQSGMRRIGALLGGTSAKEVLQDGLTRRGWTLGKNLHIEYRTSSGDADLARRYARELIALKPDVLFAFTNTSMAALYAEGTTIPTVFAMVSDPEAMHYVDSFAKPGRNATGFTPFEPTLGGKWLSILKETAPKLRHIGLVYDPEPGNNAASFRKSIDETASVSGIASVEAPSGDSSSIERLIRALTQRPESGLIFLPDAFTGARPVQMTALVRQSRLPAVYPLRSFTEAGGLMSYGVKFEKIIDGAAAYIDRILRGTHPSDLPVQTPTEFELIVNQRAAKELGLKLPEPLIARADEVIE